MHGNDEHDPVDSWLSEQVRPLPPPPGTFELITRRARRRKVRRLAVTAATAAAVAVAVAVAVPGGLLLHVGPSPTVSGVAAGQTHPGNSSGPQPSGSGSPHTSPALTPSGTPGGLTEQPGPVPVNFQPSSVTFVGKDLGWAIGQGGTPGHCANPNPYICTSIVYTDDAGRTWHGGPAPNTGAANGATGVSGIRFLDGVNGWAFGPELWATHDAGRTWNQVSTSGQRVTDLETAGNRAYALWAGECSGASGAGFADCTSYTLMTTTAGSDNWAPVGRPTNGLTNGGKQTSAVITLTGSVGYLLAPDGTLFSGPIGGTWQKAGTAPCQPGAPTANGLPGDAWLAVASPAHLAIACQQIAASAPLIYTSGNGGAFWVPQSSPGASASSGPGTATSLAAAPNGTLVLATTSGIFVRPAGDTTWKPTNATGSGAPSGGFSYAGMTFNDQGVALPADSGLHAIWMTFNGGLTWQPATPITPGN